MKPFARMIVVPSLALAYPPSEASAKGNSMRGAGNGRLVTNNTKDLKKMRTAMKKMMMAALFAAMVAAAGCDNVISAHELVERTGGDEVNTIMWTYYIGSENECDCFCHVRLGLLGGLVGCPSVNNDTFYAVRSSEFPTFTRRFPRTDDRAKWSLVTFKEDWRGVEILTDDIIKRLGDSVNHVNETSIERNGDEN